jgi:hypothetical protein
MSGDLVPRSASEVADLADFEDAMMAFLGTSGLPTDGVLVPVRERQAVFGSFGHALGRLSSERVGKSLYLSKFVAAVRSGLFDAALNYLWDETISELRRRIAGYDLQYFFDLAVGDPQRRQKLKTEEDLRKVEDAELILAANKMGLISDVGYKQLDLVRYMRNYASAAHPNQNEITGLQLVGWLDTCIVEVITLPESVVVVEIRKLLGNLKANRLTEADAAAVASSFDKLAPDQADNLGNGLFGIYTNLESTNEVRDNVRLLFPTLWVHLRDDGRRGFGVKFGRYQANSDIKQAALARELLDTVDASSYLPESFRVAEIDRAIDDLLLAHRGFNNFYSEPPLARALSVAVGERGDVPSAVAVKYVTSLVEVFLTNGNGVAWNAQPVYQELIGKFNVREAEFALRQFTDPVIASRLQNSLSQEKWKEFVELLAPKVTSPKAQQLLGAVRAFDGPLSHMADASEIKAILGQPPAR